MWKQSQVKEYHNKTEWIRILNDKPTGEIIISGSEVCARKNEKWIKNQKGLGMVRESPIKRFSASILVRSSFTCCVDKHTLICVAWSEIPSECDYSYKQYLEDSTRVNFLGIVKSQSAVNTFIKNYMKLNP